MRARCFFFVFRTRDDDDDDEEEAKNNPRIILLSSAFSHAEKKTLRFSVQLNFKIILNGSLPVP